MASEVRRLALTRLDDDVRPSTRLLVDADDLVQETCRLILRRNRCPSAFDPRKATLGTYVYQVAGNALANLLEPAKRRRHRELHDGGQERRDAHGQRLDADWIETLPAPEADPDAAPFDLDAAPSEPDAREAFWLAACCLEVLGELPVSEELWRRALRQRTAAGQLSLDGRVEESASERVPAEPRAPRERRPTQPDPRQRLLW